MNGKTAFKCLMADDLRPSFCSMKANKKSRKLALKSFIFSGNGK